MKISKIKKLQLDISEEKLVDLVAYGIADENIRRNVQAGRYKDIPNLKRCLTVFNVTSKDLKVEKKRMRLKVKQCKLKIRKPRLVIYAEKLEI